MKKKSFVKKIHKHVKLHHKKYILGTGIGFLTFKLIALALSLAGVGNYMGVQASEACNTITDIPNIECEALVDIYNNTDGVNRNDNTNWMGLGDTSTDTACDRSGVICDAGYVTQIILNGNNLNGILTPTIGTFSKLINLDLSYNSLQGNIPQSLGYITGLVAIKIENNQLTGFIPYSIKLGNLGYFSYNGNLLSGIINDGTYASQTIEGFLTLMDTQYISPIDDGRDGEILAPDIILAGKKLAVPTEPGLDINKIYKTFSVGSNITFLAPGTGEFEMQIKIDEGNPGDTLKVYLANTTDGNTWTGNTLQNSCTLDVSNYCIFSTNRLGLFAIEIDIDTTPDQFNFNPVTGAELDTLYLSNNITLTGMSPGVFTSVITRCPDTYKNGQLVYGYITGGNGDLFHVSKTSSTYGYNTPVYCNLSIGGVESTFTVTTKIADTTPNQFGFTNITNAEVNTLYTSNIIILTGMSPGVFNTGMTTTCTDIYKNGILVPGTPMAIFSGANGDTFYLGKNSSSNYGTSVLCTIQAMGNTTVTEARIITTKTDTTPDLFYFTNITGANLNRDYISNTIIITGMSADISTGITVDNGYLIKNGAETGLSLTGENGDQFQIFLTSSTGYNTLVSSILSIGGVTGTFDIMTKQQTFTPPHIPSNPVVRNNDNFITEGFWSQSPGDQEVKEALFGINTGDKTAYTNNRSGNICDINNITVEYLTAGINTIPHQLSGNMIYILDSGDYKISYNNGIWIDSCSVVIGSGNITIHSTGYILSPYAMIYATGKQNIILDNLNIDGIYSSQNQIGIGIYYSQNNSINKLTAYNNGFYGIRINNSPQSEINNSQTYNNNGDGIYFSNSSQSIVNNSQSYNNNSNGISFTTNPKGIINNSQTYNNNNDGISFSSSPQSSINNSQSYNNNSDGIAFTTSTGNIINNSQAYNNNDRGISFISSYDNIYYGSLSLFSNGNTVFLYTYITGGSITDTLVLEAGWSTGILNTGGTMSRDYITNPINQSGVYLLDRGTGFINTRGRKSLIFNQSNIVYSYGSSILSQTQPVMYSGTMLITGGVFDSTKYIGSDLIKKTGDLIGLSNNTTSTGRILTGTSTSPITKYSLFGDIINYIYGQDINTQTGVTLSASTGSKKIIVQLYDPTTYFATHFEKTGYFSILGSDTTAPTVSNAYIYSGTTGNNGNTGYYKGTVDIKADVSDLNGISGSTCEYTIDGNNRSGAIYSGTLTTGYCYKIGIIGGSDLDINFRARDTSNNIGTGTSKFYIYDGTAPIFVFTNNSGYECLAGILKIENSVDTGVGLNTNPYSFDGITWNTSSGIAIIKVPGNPGIVLRTGYVRDILGNIAIKTATYIFNDVMPNSSNIRVNSIVGNNPTTINWLILGNAYEGNCGTGNLSYSGILIQGTKGSCVNTGPTGITYTPNQNQTGSDVCTIQIKDDENSTANISITWTGIDTLNGNIYYVSYSSGNDSNNGLSTSTPWKTIAKVNSGTFLPGSSILFKRGDVRKNEKLIINSIGSVTGSIHYGDYGTGEKPKISGLTTISGWINEGNGIYSKSITGESIPNIVTVNGVNTALGRRPNTGYITIDSHISNTSLSSSHLNSSLINRSGATVVIRKHYYIIDRNLITNHTGNTINYISSSVYDVINGFGFFIQNDIKTLDQVGERAYTSGKIYMYFGGNNPSMYTVKISTQDKLLSSDSKHYISINNLAFEGANSTALEIITSNNFVVNGCDIKFGGKDGINIKAGSNNTSVINTLFEDNNNNGLYCGTREGSASGATIRGNTFNRSALIPGMGGDGDISGIAAYIACDNALIENNIIYQAGFNGIHFDRSNTIVRKNYISQTNSIKYDGAGIYTWQGAYAGYTGMKIQDNIVVNTIGANEGTNNMNHRLAHGIYIDDYSEGIEINGNTCAGNMGAGIKIGSSVRNIDMSSGNTLYNNIYQYHISRLISGYPNMDIGNSILFSLTTGEYNYRIEATVPFSGNMNLLDDRIQNIGTIDNNYRASISGNDNVVIAYQPSYMYKNFSQWKSYSNLDSNSTEHSITTTGNILFEYNTGDTNKIVALSGTYTDFYGNIKSGNVTIVPYSSTVLIKTSNIIDYFTEQFTFINKTGAELNTLYTSNIVIISGMSPGLFTGISLNNGYMTKNGIDIGQSGTGGNGDQIILALTSANSYASTVSSILNIGGVTGSWYVTTKSSVPNITNISSNNINGSYGYGNNIDVKISFNNQVKVLGVPKLTLNTNPIRTGIYLNMGLYDVDFDIGSGLNGFAIMSVEIQNDNKIIAGGTFTGYKGFTSNNILRLNYDGSIDTGFNIGSGFNNGVNKIKIQNDGKILVGGQFSSYNGQTVNKVVRLNTGGSIDSSFNLSGYFSSVYTIDIQNNGKIIIGGDFGSFNGQSAKNIVRLNADGSIDSSFDVGSGFNNTLTKVIVQNDGKILVGGSFTYYKGYPIKYIARLNTDGLLDSSFNPGSSFSYGYGPSVDNLAVQDDGKIIVLGYFTSYQGWISNGIIRLNTGGSIDNTFNIGDGFNSFGGAIKIQNDGKILVGGQFSSYNGQSSNRIIRLNNDGSVDTGFDIGSGFDSNFVIDLSVQQDGKIVAGGTFKKFNNYNANNLVRLGEYSYNKIFTYTIQDLDLSYDLDYLNTNSLILDGGSIKDKDYNNAILTLSEPGTIGSLGYNKNIIIGIDYTPNQFNFLNKTGAEFNTLYTSNIVIISGMSPGLFTGISLNNGYMTKNGINIGQSGTGGNGDQIILALTSANSYTSGVSSILNIGGVTGSFVVTTKSSVPSSIIWNNNNFIDQSFWNLSPNSTDIIYAIYGSGINDKTAYTNTRTGNNCNYNNLNVVIVEPGLDTIPEQLSTNTIYVLNSGNYKISYGYGVPMDNCSSIIGSGDVTIYTTGSIPYGTLSANSKHNIVVDNINIDGTGNGDGGSHNINDIGMKLDISSNNSINNSKFFNNQYGIDLLGVGGGSNNINNSKFFNNQYGIYIYFSSDNNINNSQTYDNNNGIYLENSSNNSINNSQTYNNTSNGISIYYSSDNNINNSQTYDNYDGVHIYNSTGNIINHSTAYNNNFGIDINHSSNNSITGVQVFSNQIGIYLQSNSKNNSINNSQAHDNVGAGIILDNSTNNSINNSQSYNNRDGIYLNSNSNNNSINNSQSYNNILVGIGFYSSKYNTIDNAKVYNNENGIIFSNSGDYNNINNSQSYNNILVGIFLSESSNSIINNSQSYNNGDAGIFLSNSSNVIVNNSQVYNNKEGMQVSSSSNNIINNTRLQNNKNYSMFFNSSTGNKYYGELLSIFDGSNNLIGTNGYDVTLSGGLSNDSIVSALGWTNGVLNTGGTMSRDYITNPLNISGNYLLPRGSGFTDMMAGNTLYANETIGYSYGSWTLTQIQPVIYSGNNLITGGVFDTSKYIGSDLIKKTGNLIGLSNNMTGNEISLTGISTSPVTKYSLFGDIFKNIYGQNINTKTGVTLSAGTGTKKIIVQLYDPNTYFATHFEKTGYLSVLGADIISPNISNAYIYSGTIGNNGTTGYYKGMVDIRADVSDLNGISGSTCQYNTGLSSRASANYDGSNYCYKTGLNYMTNIIINFRVRDTIGNLGTGTSKLYIYDSTAPTFTFANNSGYECVSGNLDITIANDAGIGLSSNPYSFDGTTRNNNTSTVITSQNTIGTITRTGYVSDSLSNINTHTATYTFNNVGITANNFTGNANVTNSAKTANWLNGSNALEGACGNSDIIFNGFISTGSKGTCTINGNNITYTPNQNQTGSDTCTIQIKDNENSTANITIKRDGINTVTINTIPDLFSFNTITGANLLTLYTSNIVTISGMSNGAFTSAITTCGVIYKNNSLLVSNITGGNGDQFYVGQTTTNSYNQRSNCYMSLGGVTGNFNVLTKEADYIPNSFSFVNITGAEFNTLYTSNIVIITGMSPGVFTSINLNNGYMTKNNINIGQSGTGGNGDQIILALTSANSYWTTLNSILNVGGVTGIWYVTTKNTTGSWDNDNFIDGSFWDQDPTSGDIKKALFGSGISDKTAYTENRSGNNCFQSGINVIYKTGGLDKLPQTLSSNTIYVLDSGDYRISYSNGVWMSSCSAVVGFGNVNIYSSGELNTDYGMIYVTRPSNPQKNTIIDNIKIDGKSDGIGGYHTGNQNGIYLYGGGNNTINNSQAYNNKYGIYGIYEPSNSSINNSQFYNNNHGIIIGGSNYKINNVQSYNNNGVGIYLSSSSNSLIANSQTYNNSGNGINLSSSTNSIINNSESYNNNIGIYIGQSSRIVISNSKTHNNIQQGIYLSNSSNSLIANSRSYNNPYGIYISGIGNVITNSQIYNNDYGIRSDGSENSLNNSQLYNNAVGIHFDNSTHSKINNSQIYNNNSRGIEVYPSSNKIAINNSQIYNNGGGVFFYISLDSIINNSQIYNNNSRGIEFYSGSSNNKINDSQIYNNQYGIRLLDRSINNSYYGKLKIFNNTILGTGLEVGTGVYYTTLGRTTGSIDTGGYMDCSRMTNPVNTGLTYLQTSNLCNTIGNILSRSTNIANNYRYGSNILIQTQPIQRSGTELLLYGTSGIDFDTNKYIGQYGSIGGTFNIENNTGITLSNLVTLYNYITGANQMKFSNNLNNWNNFENYSSIKSRIISGNNTGLKNIYADFSGNEGLFMVMDTIIYSGNEIIVMDYIPNSFSFVNKTGAELNTLYTSNTVIITGMSPGVFTSVNLNNGYMTKNGINIGQSGTGGNGDQIILALTSANSYASGISSILNIGGVTGSWYVTTKDNSGYPVILGASNGSYYTGNVNIQISGANYSGTYVNGIRRTQSGFILSGANNVLTQYYLTAYNIAGNFSTVNFIIDNAVPITIDNTNTNKLSGDAIITLTGTDSGIGIYNTRYCVDIVGGACTPNITGKNVSVTGASNAVTQKVVRYFSKDLLGNIEGIKTSNTITIDKQAPQNLGFNINNGAIYTTGVNITLTNITGTDLWTPIDIAYGTSATPSNRTGWSVSKSFIIENTDGLKTIYMRLRDAGGNISSSITGTIILDATSPVITINNPNTSPATGKIITASTNEGVLTMTTGTTNNTCDASRTFVTYASTTFVSESDNGKYVCYRSIDTGGNIAYGLSNAIQGIDNTSPTMTVVSPSANIGTTGVLISLNTNENAECRYSNTSGIVFGSMTLLNGTLTSHTGNYIANNGVNNIYFKCNDVAGNIANETKYIFTVDTINPIANFVSATLPNLITNNSVVNISITGTNITAYKYRLVTGNSCVGVIYNGATGSLSSGITQGPSTSDLTYSYCIVGYNATAGRSTTGNIYTFIYDNTAPVITVIDGANANRNTGDNINLNVNYNLAGASGTRYIFELSSATGCNASANFSATTNYTPGTNMLINDENRNGKYICFKTEDLAGNASYTGVGPFKIDLGSPVTTINITGLNRINTNVLFYLNGTDRALWAFNQNLSGCNLSGDPMVAIACALNQRDSGCPNECRNITGGVGLNTTYYKILTGDVSCTVGNYLTYAGDIAIDANVGETLIKSVCYYSVDGLNNTESYKKQLYKIDKQGPVVSLISPLGGSTSTGGTSINFVWSGSDNGIGISGYIFRLYNGINLITGINITGTNITLSNLLNGTYLRNVESIDILGNSGISNTLQFVNINTYVILPITSGITGFISEFTGKGYLLGTGSNLFETGSLSGVLVGFNPIFFGYNNEIKVPIIMQSTGSIDNIEIKMSSGTLITKTGANASGCENFILSPVFVSNNLANNLSGSQNIFSTFVLGSNCSNVSIKFIDNSGANKDVIVRLKSRDLANGDYKIWYSENGTTRNLLGTSSYANNKLEFITNHMTYFTITQDRGNLLDQILSLLGGGSARLTKDNCKYSATKNNLPGANDEGIDYSDSYYDKDCGENPGTDTSNMIIDGIIDGSPYTDEINKAYLYAYRASITTIGDINRADMMGSLLRKHMAKMIVNYAINIIGKIPDDSVNCNFVDMDYEDSEMQDYAKQACQLGLMGLKADGTPSDKFYPGGLVTRSQFGTALSRLIYGEVHNAANGTNRYEGHLTALKSNGIMNNIAKPNMTEKRGYVMLMLMRAGIN